MSIHYDQQNYPSGTVLIRDFEGNIEVQDIIESWKFLLTNNMLDENVLGVINNICACNLKMDINSFQYLIAYLKTEAAFKRIRLAVICEDPKKIIFPSMGEFIENLQIKPFTTYDAAIDWILKQ
ncbi:hypothetical protein ACE1ET_01410 [Saccharicrinis sp. FJH62]|uniref:hypothetical protein n=1 Tax=Saccharicrinis sp. FJH62 TaxID=3344657 RepID=UPI0035D46DB1